MSRVLAVIAACLLLCVRAVEADTVQTNVTQLSNSGSYKVRLAAALALSKSKDARAVIALADALENDTDPTIRREPVMPGIQPVWPRMVNRISLKSTLVRSRMLLFRNEHYFCG